jgi:hypothetical protein
LPRLGTPCGVHPHMARWVASDHRWVVDHGDQSWVSECVETSFAAYRTAFGAPPEQQRFGAAWWSDEALALVARLGTRFDLTAEPGERNRPPDSTPSVLWRGDFPNVRGIDQVPHRPMHLEGVPDDLWEIPLTSEDEWVGGCDLASWWPGCAIRRARCATASAGCGGRRTTGAARTCV